MDAHSKSCSTHSLHFSHCLPTPCSTRVRQLAVTDPFAAPFQPPAGRPEWLSLPLQDQTLSAMSNLVLSRWLSLLLSLFCTFLFQFRVSSQNPHTCDRIESASVAGTFSPWESLQTRTSPMFSTVEFWRHKRLLRKEPIWVPPIGFWVFVGSAIVVPIAIWATCRHRARLRREMRGTHEQEMHRQGQISTTTK